MIGVERKRIKDMLFLPFAPAGSVVSNLPITRQLRISLPDCGRSWVGTNDRPGILEADVVGETLVPRTSQQ